MFFAALRYGPLGGMRKALVAGLLSLVASAAAAEVRIVALGDSLTHGYGLAAEDGFVPKLEAWLRANGAPDAVVVNAGVSGDTTAGGRARLAWSLADGADALIVELGGNDLLRAMDPKATRENLDAILTEAGQSGLPVLLAGMRAPLNYGREYKEAFDTIFPDLAAKHDALLYPFFLDGLVGQGGLFQSDGIHPNEAGVEALVAKFGPAALELYERAKAE